MDLEKLVEQMRSLGIRHYKNGDIEIVLDEVKPVVQPVPVDNSDPFNQRMAKAAREHHLKIAFGASSMVPRLKRDPK